MPEELSWYYNNEGNPVGPLMLQDLRARLAQSTAWKNISVWRAGFDDWIPAGSVPELQQIKPPPPIQPASGPPPIPSEATSPAAQPPLLRPQFAQLPSIRPAFMSHVAEWVGKLWVRAVILLVFLTVTIPIGIWAMLSENERESVSTFTVLIALKAAWYLGYCAPALVIGGAWGWLRYSKASWLKATGFLLFVTIALYLHNT